MSDAETYVYTNGLLHLVYRVYPCLVCGLVVMSHSAYGCLLSFVFNNLRSVRPRRPLFGLHHDMYHWLDGAVVLWVVMDRSPRCLWVCLVFVWGVAVGWVCACVDAITTGADGGAGGCIVS